MVFYKYDKDTGKLIKEFTPQVDKLETKKAGKIIYAFPRNITDEKLPIEFNPSKHDCYFENDKWILYNKITVYNKKTKECILTNQKNFDDINYTEIPVPPNLITCPFSYWDEEKQEWVLNEELKQKTELEDLERAQLINKVKDLEERIFQLESQITATIKKEIQEK